MPVTTKNSTSTAPAASEPELAENSAAAMDQLASVLSAYNNVAERMQRSHDTLQQEVVRLRQEVADKNEQLERARRLAALGEMAAGMAHEIRNPLGAVQLYASLLERDLAENPDEVVWVRKISKAVRSLDQIVSDILAFTHDQVCEKAPVRLASVIDDVIEYVSPSTAAKDITIDTTAVDQELHANLDSRMMGRTLLNIVLNAVEAVPGPGVVRIAAGACSDEPPYALRIDVTDTGPGFNSETLNKIFNPFFTTKDTGTGLGLAIVHRLIECHGGVISAHNAPQGGAAFTILLP